MIHYIIYAAPSCYTVHGKILVEEKLAYLVNREPFAKIFLANIYRYTENI